MYWRVCCLLIASCLPLVGCVWDGVEEKFFDEPIRTASTRIEKYPLNDQYKIFRYGYVKIHPPLGGLAFSIAKHGQAAVPLLLREMNGETDEMALSGIYFIFEVMGRNGNYDVESDKSLMQKLEQRAASMKSAWRSNAEASLARLRAGK